MYESPIELFYNSHMEEIKTSVEDAVVRGVVNCGIEVDKDELIKALAYDRGQYEKGFADGWAAAKGRVTVAMETLRAVLEERYGTKLDDWRP